MLIENPPLTIIALMDDMIYKFLYAPSNKQPLTLRYIKKFVLVFFSERANDLLSLKNDIFQVYLIWVQAVMWKDNAQRHLF